MGEILLKLKEARANIIVGGFSYILLGILLAVFPLSTIRTLAVLIGLILVLVGGIQILGKVIDDQNRSSGILVGCVIAAIGIWIMLNPRFIMSMLPIVIGVMLVVSAIQQITMAFGARQSRFQYWWHFLIQGILDFIIGSVCIVHAFAVGTLLAVMEGIMLIFVGVTSIISAFRMGRFERSVMTVSFTEKEL